jgi:GT2 family glycosyltransferase
VILLNDDTKLKTPVGFQSLSRIAMTDSSIGMVSAAIDNVGNCNQNPKGSTELRFDKMLCFICVLFKKELFEDVGYFDERFDQYGWDDNDFCMRAKDKGWKLGIWDQCYVNHSDIPSSFRKIMPKKEYFDKCKKARDIFRAKWGV